MMQHYSIYFKMIDINASERIKRAFERIHFYR
jgi:hypothetical protein